MSKKDLTEQEIRSQYIRPAIINAGWKDSEIREEYHYTAGRMHITGQKAVRDTTKFANYLLSYKNVHLAVVEAKDNNHSVGAGMQQGLAYAADLDKLVVYNSNGDGFSERGKLSSLTKTQSQLSLTDFSSPNDFRSRFKTQPALTPGQDTRNLLSVAILDQTV